MESIRSGVRCHNLEASTRCHSLSHEYSRNIYVDDLYPLPPPEPYYCRYHHHDISVTITVPLSSSLFGCHHHYLAIIVTVTSTVTLKVSHSVSQSALQYLPKGACGTPPIVPLIASSPTWITYSPCTVVKERGRRRGCDMRWDRMSASQH